MARAVSSYCPSFTVLSLIRKSIRSPIISIIVIILNALNVQRWTSLIKGSLKSSTDKLKIKSARYTELFNKFASSPGDLK